MATSKLSEKYQIVIPKAVRQRLGLKSGMFITLRAIDRERAVLIKQPTDYVQALEGLGKDVWKLLGGGEKYIKQERATWLKRSV